MPLVVTELGANVLPDIVAHTDLPLAPPSSFPPSNDIARLQRFLNHLKAYHAPSAAPAMTPLTITVFATLVAGSATVSSTCLRNRRRRFLRELTKHFLLGEHACLELGIALLDAINQDSGKIVLDLATDRSEPDRQRRDTVGISP